MLIVSQACITKAYLWGLGKHDIDLTIDQLINILKWAWIKTTTSILVSIIARISITILLIRIYGNIRSFKMFLIASTTLQTVVGVIIIIVVWVQASPVQGLWNPAIEQDMALLLQCSDIPESYLRLRLLTPVKSLVHL